MSIVKSSIETDSQNINCKFIKFTTAEQIRDFG